MDPNQGGGPRGGGVVFFLIFIYRGVCIQIFVGKSIKLRELFNIEGGAENFIEIFLTKSKKHRQEKFLENWVIWIG